MDNQARRFQSNASQILIPSPSESLTVRRKQQVLQILNSRVVGSSFSGIPPRPPTSLPTHSSLPSFANLNHQFQSSSRSPPLLPLPPLPVSRSRSLPCYSHRKTKTINNQRKPSLSSDTKNKPGMENGNRTCGSPFPAPPPVTKTDKVEEKQDKKEEGEIDDDDEQVKEEIFFFTSPPPSSLPLPRFTLKPRNIATDDLRRLLRL